jgi:hypothetical protein
LHRSDVETLSPVGRDTPVGGVFISFGKMGSLGGHRRGRFWSASITNLSPAGLAEFKLVERIGFHPTAQPSAPAILLR